MVRFVAKPDIPFVSDGVEMCVGAKEERGKRSLI
jgi:hypothetical protein